MALAPPRPCAEPRCPFVATAHGRCAAHQRPSASARGYTTQWTAYARAWLQQFPWCGQRSDGSFSAEHSRCVQRGLRTRARVVDHIVSLAHGGALMDARNHQSLCRSCNVVKG